MQKGREEELKKKLVFSGENNAISQVCSLQGFKNKARILVVCSNIRFIQLTCRQTIPLEEKDLESELCVDQSSDDDTDSEWIYLSASSPANISQSPTSACFFALPC